MPDFITPSLNDELWIKQKIAFKSFPTCEYSFGNIISYLAVMDIRIADAYGCLVTRCTFKDGFVEYCFPVGNGDVNRAISFILEDGIKNGVPFGIFGMNKEDALLLKAHFGEHFDIGFERDVSDYVYLSEDLIKLKGKKYQPKRNHISFFLKNYNWKYEKITRDNIDECIIMAEKWLESCEHKDKNELEDELLIIRKAFSLYEELGFIGGLIRVDGRVVAFTMGEKIAEDIFCVHFEKAFPDIRGAYPMINKQFVMNELNGYKYINREDDTGSPNLRKAKLSYHPVIIAEKYEAVYKNADKFL